jgi:hypothetical protein
MYVLYLISVTYSATVAIDQAAATAQKSNTDMHERGFRAAPCILAGTGRVQLVPVSLRCGLSGDQAINQD